MTASLYDLKGRATTTPIPSGAVLIGAVSEDAANPVLFDASSLVAQSDAFTTPQAHGAVADGVTDDLAAFVATHGRRRGYVFLRERVGLWGNQLGGK